MTSRLAATSALVAALLLPGLAGAAGHETTVTLAAQNASGESGTATLTQQGTDLVVVIGVTGEPSGASQPAHIHTGACPNPGGVVHPLTNIVDGKSTTTLANVILADVADGNHSINLHKSAAESAVYVACGDIAKMAAAAPTAMTTTAPASLPKTGGEMPAWLLVLGVAVLLSGLAVHRARRTV